MAATILVPVLNRLHRLIDYNFFLFPYLFSVKGYRSRYKGLRSDKDIMENKTFLKRKKVEYTEM